MSPPQCGRDRPERQEDRLPPGLRVRGTLAAGLWKKMMRCPGNVEQQLPSSPESYEHAMIGGRIVLVNPSSYLLVDIFHFER
jgi:hypothetical protein